MDQLVTCYLYNNGDLVDFKAVSKSTLAEFIERNKQIPKIIVCDPRNRENSTYNYGEFKVKAG